MQNIQLETLDWTWQSTATLHSWRDGSSCCCFCKICTKTSCLSGLRGVARLGELVGKKKKTERFMIWGNWRKVHLGFMRTVMAPVGEEQREDVWEAGCIQERGGVMKWNMPGFSQEITNWSEVLWWKKIRKKNCCINRKWQRSPGNPLTLCVNQR